MANAHTNGNESNRATPVLMALPKHKASKTMSFACLESLGQPSVACHIRVLRTQRGWTQAELAGRANINQSGVSQLENSPEDCPLFAFIAVSEAFGITVYDLMQEPVITIKNGRSRLRPRDVQWAD